MLNRKSKMSKAPTAGVGKNAGLEAFIILPGEGPTILARPSLKSEYDRVAERSVSIAGI